MTVKHFIVATAGHVDHGKSSLVRALTGLDPDRLPEEKQRGITIELGFAHLELHDAASATSYQIGVVDVPGHEDFVKNMVSGVGSIDAAILVVAADDRWMPQTEEHLQILQYLGVENLLIALTKADLVEDSNQLQMRLEEVRTVLQATVFAKAQIVPVAAPTGAGLGEFKSALCQLLSKLHPPADISKPRLPIDRIFQVQGIGTVVTGTLQGGKLRTGQEVIIQPGGNRAKIRSLQTHWKKAEESGPGQRVGLNLPELERKTEGKPGAQRGHTVTIASVGEPTTTIDLWLERSARAGLHGTKDRPLKDGTIAWVHIGSAQCQARIFLLERPELVPGEACLAQVRLNEPTLVFVGDRLVVREWSEQGTIAGGLVLNVHGDRKYVKSERYRKFLELRRTDFSASSCVISEVFRGGVLTPQHLLAPSRFSEAEIQNALQKAIKERSILKVGEWLISPGWWQERKSDILRLVAEIHGKFPERLGMKAADLRGTLAKTIHHAGVLEKLIAELAESGALQHVAETLKIPTHRPALPKHLAAFGTRLRAAIQAKPLEPPSKKELAVDVPSAKALQFLIDSGEVIDLGPEAILAADVFATMKGTIQEELRSRGAATASELRQKIGTTRRILIPLLEYLDRVGVTVRDGDRRRLRS